MCGGEGGVVPCVLSCDCSLCDVLWLFLVLSCWGEGGRSFVVLCVWLFLMCIGSCVRMCVVRLACARVCVYTSVYTLCFSIADMFQFRIPHCDHV